MVYEFFVKDECIGYAEDYVSMIQIEAKLIKKFGADAVDVYEFQPTEGWLHPENVDDITLNYTTP